MKIMTGDVVRITGYASDETSPSLPSSDMKGKLVPSPYVGRIGIVHAKLHNVRGDKFSVGDSHDDPFFIVKFSGDLLPNGFWSEELELVAERAPRPPPPPIGVRLRRRRVYFRQQKNIA